MRDGCDFAASSTSLLLHRLKHFSKYILGKHNDTWIVLFSTFTLTFFQLFFLIIFVQGCSKNA